MPNLISFVNEAKGGSKRSEGVEICYLDFQRVFDSANHRYFDQNVKAFGVDAKLNNWIAQNLKGGSLFVRVTGYLLNRRLLYSGR